MVEATPAPPTPPEVLWQPPDDVRKRSRMGRWDSWLSAERGLAFEGTAESYHDIVRVPAVPRTISGKKLEVPVKRLLTGAPAEEVTARDALIVPAAQDHFASLSSGRLAAAQAEAHGSAPEVV
jgi:hypothetical protein